MSLENLPPLDIQSFLRAATLFTFLGVILAIWRGVRNIQTSRDLPYFRLRRERLLKGWRQLIYSILLLLLGIFLLIWGEPVAYSYIAITTTPSLTPTVTITPTITLSPTITETPTITFTPAITPTARVPLVVEALFESDVTPVSEAIFSPLTFSQAITNDLEPVRPDTVFQNPVGDLYATFSYDGMDLGVQWTALWYHDGELVHFETIPWDAGTGGLGFADWNPPPDKWLPGNYEVQIFVGLDWKVVGNFIVEGDPPTATPAPTKTSPPTSTFTRSPTPEPSSTPTITPTGQKTSTPMVTKSPTPPPVTPRTPTPTRYPTLTRTLTPTRWPTLTRTPTP
jgi:type VI secretion system secreted protein VgrG